MGMRMKIEADFELLFDLSSKILDGIDSEHQDKQIFIERQESNGTHVPIITPSPNQTSRRRGSGNNNSNYSANGSGSNNSSFVAKSRKPSRRLSRDSRSSSEPYPAGAIIPRKLDPFVNMCSKIFFFPSSQY